MKIYICTYVYTECKLHSIRKTDQYPRTCVFVCTYILLYACFAEFNIGHAQLWKQRLYTDTSNLRFHCALIASRSFHLKCMFQLSAIIVVKLAKTKSDRYLHMLQLSLIHRLRDSVIFCVSIYYVHSRLHEIRLYIYFLVLLI